MRNKSVGVGVANTSSIAEDVTKFIILVIIMNEKRFLLDKVEKGNAILSVKITDSVSDDNYFIMTKDFYEDDIDEIVDLLNEQQTTIEQLKKRLYDFEKRKIIEESEIDEDVIPKVKVLRTELFGEKYE